MIVKMKNKCLSTYKNGRILNIKKDHHFFMIISSLDKL